MQLWTTTTLWQVVVTSDNEVIFPKPCGYASIFICVLWKTNSLLFAHGFFIIMVQFYTAFTPRKSESTKPSLGH